MTDHPGAARERRGSRVALVTCADLPELDPDDRRLVAPLQALGLAVDPVVWDDPAVDWTGYELAVLRSTWDYPPRREEFVAWAAKVPRLANPGHLVSWNTDKRYLVELDIAGVPVVPTNWLAGDDRWRPPADGEWVIKPAVGAGSKDCGRYRLADPVHRRLAAAHVDRLKRAGRLVMVQPYLPAVDDYGETALLFIADPARGRLTYSHAVRKGPMLAGPDRGTHELFHTEHVTERVPSAAELALARRALAAVPADPAQLLYARVDLIPGRDGRPLLVELELTEPSLFLAFEPSAARRFATAIASKIASI